MKVQLQVDWCYTKITSLPILIMMRFVSGMLVNSFDLVRIHLYGAQDEDAKTDTPG